jgi:hypothetical protein
MAQLQGVKENCQRWKVMAKKAKKKAKESKDNPAKNFAITGYLKDFTKEKKEKDGVEPTLADFRSAIDILVQTDTVEAIGIKCMVMQVEQGENGTMHLQGYLQTHKRKRRDTLNNLIRKHTPFNFSIQNARGSASQNVQYCSKETGLWQYANGNEKMNTTLTKKPIWINEKLLVKKGERNDLKEAIRAIENGASLRQLDERFASQMVRFGRGLGDLAFRKKMAESKVLREVKVVVLFGGAGAGKSYAARYGITEQYGYSPDDVYSLDWEGSTLWFGGYNGEKVLLLDDYTPNSIKRSILLKLMDIYQFTGQTKGGHIVGEWDLVIFTTNSEYSEIATIEEWVEIDGRIEKIEYPDAAFYSRITEFYDYNGMPDLRRTGGDVKVTRMRDVPKSVTSLLPVTLTHGTISDCDKGQNGSVRDVIPHQAPLRTDETTSAQSTISGTKSGVES